MQLVFLANTLPIRALKPRVLTRKEREENHCRVRSGSRWKFPRVKGSSSVEAPNDSLTAPDDSLAAMRDS